MAVMLMIYREDEKADKWHETVRLIRLREERKGIKRTGSICRSLRLGKGYCLGIFDMPDFDKRDQSQGSKSDSSM